MIIEDRDGVFRKCEELGEEAVRARLQSGSLTIFERPLMQEWLNRRDAEKRAKAEQQEGARAERSLAASERAAAAAEDSAKSSRRSARMATLALVLAAASALATALKSCAVF